MGFGRRDKGAMGKVVVFFYQPPKDTTLEND